MEPRTLLEVILGVTSLVAAVLGIVPLALSTVGNLNSPGQFQCYVALDIVAIILLFAGAIVAFVIACRNIYHSYPLLVVCAVIIPLGRK
ncbi:hypothetical protein FGIG_12283 [Fasciola gigantica]|uniref:Uncharacterized protein n=1 Tax=Fasciola gigantica TaxID=46835 RepID=A0A504YNH6_FASGI|nr:hypothetical protein FGIG_12283 [Fasciola gigantica]